MQTLESSPGSRVARRTAGGCPLGWLLVAIAVQAVLVLPAAAQSVMVRNPYNGGSMRDESATRAVREMERRYHDNNNGVREWFAAMYEAEDAAALANTNAAAMAKRQRPAPEAGDFMPVPVGTPPNGDFVGQPAPAAVKAKGAKPQLKTQGLRRSPDQKITRIGDNPLPPSNLPRRGKAAEDAAPMVFLP